MGRLCERPGCSRPAAATYMIDVGRLVVSIAPLGDTVDRGGVLCRAHATAMTAPRGWSVDDRRVDAPPLFQSEAAPTPLPRIRPARRAVAAGSIGVVEQLRLDAVPVPATSSADANTHAANESVTADTGSAPELDETQALPWVPRFDGADPDVLAGATSPLLARAFRAQPRRR